MKKSLELWKNNSWIMHLFTCFHRFGIRLLYFVTKINETNRRIAEKHSEHSTKRISTAPSIRKNNGANVLYLTNYFKLKKMEIDELRKERKEKENSPNLLICFFFVSALVKN